MLSLTIQHLFLQMVQDAVGGAYIPAGMSTKTLLHFRQHVLSGKPSLYMKMKHLQTKSEPHWQYTI